MNESRNDNVEMVDGDTPADSGDQSTTETEEAVMIPAPDSPLHSAGEPPATLSNDSGHTSEAISRNFAPFQAPQYEGANYDNPPYGLLHELCGQRGYHRKDTKAALKTRVETLEAVEPLPPGGAVTDMGTSSSILGPRPRDL